MKICPECAFANEERFPTCVWCNTLLTGVKSTPSADPDHPEHVRRRLGQARLRQQRRQLAFILSCYVATITFLAVVPGLYFDSSRLGEFAGLACLVGVGIVAGWLGPISSMLAQGVASTALVLHSGPLNPLLTFMLLGHVVLPAVFAHWVDLLDSTHH